MENKRYTQETIIDYINNLKGYQGYIQMSDKPISDIWENFSDISFTPSSGFVYEAYFFNGIDSISIKQINDGWLVSKTNISKQLEAKKQDKNYEDIQTYHAINGLKVKMVQIWESENDSFCENTPVLKLKKVVFAGFVKGDDK